MQEGNADDLEDNGTSRIICSFNNPDRLSRGLWNLLVAPI
jgi:hypothetical protein